MKPSLRHRIHHFHFILLLLLLTLCATAILFFGFNSQYRLASVIVFALVYFLWGIIHHYKDGDLHSEIIVEYLLIATLGAVLLISVILKA